MLILLEGFFDFGVGVHHERAAANHRLFDGFAVHDQKFGVRPRFYADALAGPGEDCQVALDHVAPAIRCDFTAQGEEGARVAIGQGQLH